MNAAEAAAMADCVRLRPTLWRHGPKVALRLASQVAAAGRPGGGWWSSLAQLGLAEVHLAAGDVPACLAELADSDEHTDTDEATAAYRWALRAAALAKTGQGDREAEEAMRHAERSGLAHQLGAAHDARARVLATRGDLEPSIVDASAAADRLAEAGSPVEEGLARQLLAALYAGTGRRAAMLAEFGQAKTLFASSSAEWLAAQLTRDERRFAARSRRVTGTGLEVLTVREREIVTLVAAGLTNRQIAERLYLSRKTVETHLSRAFAKLDVRSRVALTRRVTQSG
jgi:RNA polymerase sigma factor (sigma-70 family)